VELGLDGRVALVTGSSKGLGRASALALGQEGAKVVLSARDQATLSEAAAAMPGEALALPADVTDPETPPSWWRPPSNVSAACTCWSPTPADRRLAGRWR
jgi:NAD(P)-dependent dehydrogenase (short-subunit alcohol dehydrogenase family)